MSSDAKYIAVITSGPPQVSYGQYRYESDSSALVQFDYY